MTDPPEFGAVHLTTTFSPEIVVVGAAGWFGAYAANTGRSADNAL
jgi:hypothetical protein